MGRKEGTKREGGEGKGREGMRVGSREGEREGRKTGRPLKKECRVLRGTTEG